MSKKKSKSTVVLMVSLCMIFIGSLIGSTFQTSGHSVDVQDIQFVTEDGALLRALLYIPKEASSANPLPAVVAAHGYNNTAEVQSINAIELSRRGYVVLALDEYGHGQSTFPTENGGIIPDLGVYAAMQHLGSLSFVDTSRVGLVGHSMGGTTIQNAAVRAWENYAADETVVVPTAVLPTAQAFLLNEAETASPLEDYPVNIGVVYGRYDEWAEGMWGVLRGSEINTTSRAAAVMGVNTPQYDTYYSFETGSALDRSGAVSAAGEGNLRVMFQPQTVHPVIHFSFRAVGNVVDFFDITLRNGTTTMASGNQIWFWKEVFTGISLVGYFLFIGSFGLVLLRTRYFSTIIRTQPQAPSNPKNGKSRLLYIAIFLVCLIPAPFIYQWATGYPIDIKAMGRTVPIVFPANAVFPMPTANGLVVFNLLTGVIAMVIFYLVYSVSMVRNGVTYENLGIKLPGKDILKALLLAVTVFAAGYTLLLLADFFTETDFRFWVFSIKALSASKSWMFLVYLPFFAFTFLVSSLTLNSFTRLRRAGEAVNIILMVIASCGGLLVLCLLDYISLFTTGVKMFPYVPYPAGTTSALAGVLLWGLLFILPIAAVLARVYFKKTGSIWVGGFINAMVVTLFAISNTVVSAGVL